MLLLMLTAREGALSSRRQRYVQPAECRAASQIAHGVAVVCLGAVAGARYSVKTGENAALLNRR
jgi:hypothetical protein